eukprot:8244690-Prorocentrum_lima.AAC.1
MFIRGSVSAVGTWLGFVPDSCITMSKELCCDGWVCAGGEEPGHVDAAAARSVGLKTCSAAVAVGTAYSVYC